MPLGLGKMAGFTRSMSSLKRGLGDITTQFDHLTKEMEHGDMSQILGTERAIGPLKEVLNLLDSTNEELSKMARVKRELAKLQKKEQEHIKTLKIQEEFYKSEEKRGVKHQVALEKVGAELTEHEARLTKINDLQSDKDGKLKAMEKTWTNIAHQRQVALVGKMISAAAAQLLAKAFSELSLAVATSFKWVGSLQNALATLARRLGASTDGIFGMHAAIKASLLDKGGLGDLGFGLEDITSMMGDFAEQMQYTDKIAPETGLSLVRLGITAGMTAQQVGELSRTLVVMGDDAGDAAHMIGLINAAARQAGVSSASMAKQFTGAGKALLELTGPKSRTQLIETARYLAKLGSGLDKVKGFVDLSDTFDKTAESVAKLNTVFGTHINALTLFGEQDIGKRFEMLRKQLELQGVNLDMMRQEKKFIAETLGLDQETANALIRSAGAGEDMAKWSEKQLSLETERNRINSSYEETIMRAKNVLVATHQILGNIYETLTKTLEPLFRGFKFAAGIGEGMSIFDGIIKRAGDAFGTMMQKLEAGGLTKQLFRLGEVFGYVFDELMKIVASDDFARMMHGLIDVMIAVAQGVGLFITGVAKVVVFVFSLVAGLISSIKTALNWAGKLIGMGDIDDPSSRGTGDFATRWDEREAAKQAPSGFYSLMSTTGSSLAATATGNAFQPSAGNTAALMSSQAGSPSSGPGAQAASSGGGATPQGERTGMSSNLVLPVQVILDGEVIQESMFKRNLRGHQ
jgi:acetolactate synthase small subunit